MKLEKIRYVKPEIRTLGVDSGAHEGIMRKIDVVGIVFRGRDWLNGVLRTRIDSDGINSTDRIARMINRSCHRSQIRLIILGNIFLGKSNLIDLHKVSLRTGKPVIALIKKQDIEKKRTAFNREKLDVLKSFGKPLKIMNMSKTFHLYLSGLEPFQAEEVFKATSKVEAIPEPLRVARLMGSALNNLSYNLSHK